MTKTLAAEVKSTSDRGSGGWTAVASTDGLDRDGEVVAAKAFDPLPHSIPVHDGHGWRATGGGSQALVGRAVPRYEGRRLLVDGTFASTQAAQTVRQLVLEGMVAEMSIVFRPSQRRTIGGVPTVVSGELLACDFVTLPANREARVLASRGFGGLDPLATARRDVAEALAVLDQMDAKGIRSLLAQAHLDLAELDLAEATAALYAGRPTAAADLIRELRRY